ncbi:mandelate racemase/muconate lactonizing enzyme family protein [Aquimarina sp. BL5]|uniref:mandelate racemase/muconate lactonizing enzyme family protein n=1 Tax=Aquimarina sp. BL5 TaxID=1714860 RepID=UPI000E513D44|nr:mandelate racemase/muconate lactonizing enzyme family protein [Aquimarina sp. BL5]AXT51300.1 mandelate racemase/muconate lactonizing enzyme family protein [Aquimarina sp. BL5]RKM95631.1 mandelate racemase/muconate lactonizing enzyme family protein [Aquimarina sp. BL5]
MKELEIKDLKIYKASTPLKKPISDATHTLTEISFIVLRIKLENGIVGESYLLSFQYSPNAIIGALKDLIPIVKGYKVYETALVYKKLEGLFEYFGNQGLLRWAQSAINIAMWDAWGKVQNQPVYKLLGVTKEKVSIYGSGGWISYTIDELIEEVTNYAERGFKAVKIKVGSPKVSTDLERLRKVREAVGNEIDIMMDANQGMDLTSAVKLSNGAKDLNINWFEEPVHHQDFQAYQSLKNQTGISLAMGEREFDTLPLRELVTRNALDIWQPDILRIGGVEAWRESAALANSFHLPVLPHYYKDYDVPLLCTIPNGVGAESFDWVDPLIDNPMKIDDGYAKPHDIPGWGFTFIDDHLTEIK